MKKTDIIHLIIIITAIFLVYSALNLLPQLISYFLFWVMDGLRGGEMLQGFISLFLTVAFYIIIASLVLKNAKRWSNYIVHKYDVQDAGIINSSKHDLLYILFIGLGIYNLLQRLPILLKNLYLSFSHEVSNQLFKDPPPKSSDLVPQIITVLLSLFLVIYAKYLADQFSDKIPFEEEGHTIESTNQSL